MSTVVCPSNMSQNPTASVWGCIESWPSTEDRQKPEVYVHPSVKRSMSTLSLEMCTERLGSETGTDIMEEDDVFSSMVMSTADREPRRRNNPMQRMETTKALYQSLPPPLTILRGPNSIRVDPVREDGRLVMNVVSTSPRKPSVVAQRSNGRLTLCLAEDEEETSHGHGVESGECEEEWELNDGDEASAVEHEEGQEDEEDEKEEELRSLVIVEKEDKNVAKVKIEGRFGKREKQGLRSCKESEHGSRRLNNWKTYWVA